MTRLVMAAALLIPGALCAQASTGTCARPFEVPVEAGRHIAMHLRSGDVEITGSTKAGLRVTCTGNPDQARNVKISFAAGNLRTYGGPDRNVHFRIEVPARTDLLVRLSAGDMRVAGIEGDKDIELRAGDLTIGIERPGEYRLAEGSVMAGDLKAAAFGIEKDGLFRSFRKENADGQYRLHAQLLAGDLTLK